jgi:glycosyltransferase involved in cell wall biosynthesis
LLIATHPVQYAAPLFQLYSQDQRLEVTVAYCSLEGTLPAYDRDFDSTFAWDRPLLGGYDWIEVPNLSPRPDVRTSLGLMNVGLWSTIDPRRYDLIVSYLGYRSISSWIAIMAARLRRIPLVLTNSVHTVRPLDGRDWKVPLKRLLLPLVFNSADGVFASSSRAVKYLRGLGVRTPVYLTPNAVDTEFFRSSADASDRQGMRSEWGIPDHALVALFVGKLVPWKRPQDLIQAITQLPFAHAVLAGDGPLRSELESLADELDLSNRVHFLGFIGQSSLPSVYRASDVLVLPSEYETFGMVVGEAFSAGLPAIVSSACGCAGDLVKDGETGFVVDVADVGAVADRLTRLDGREVLANMGRAASEQIDGWGPIQNRDAVVEASQELTAS